MRRFTVLAACLCLITGLANSQALPPPTAASTLALTVTGTATPETSTPEAAATETATPTERATIDPLITLAPLNLDLTADVLFPVGAGFRLIFRQPLTGTESITLRAAQTGWVGDVVNIDLADVVTGDDGVSILHFIWQVPLDTPPALFQPVTFIWEVTPRGRTGETAEIELALGDSRFTWIAGRAPDVPVTFVMPEARSTMVIAQAQIASLARLLAESEREIAPLNAVIFPSGVSTDPCEAAMTLPDPDNADGAPLLVLRGEETALDILCDNSAAQELYADGSWIVLNATTTEPVPFVLTDAILRRAYPDLFNGEAAPMWFKSGLVAYFAGGFSPNDLASAQTASRSNLLLPSLENVPSGGAELRQWRAQSLGTVIYMSSQVGVPVMLDIIERVDAGEPLGEVWLDASGQSLDALPVGWRNWIFTPLSEAAYAQLPGLDPTPTLIPTRTLTPTRTPTPSFTPTFTLTLTPTLTPSITPSPTPLSGFALPTVAPTLTPSATPPPTLTPRPAAEAFELGAIPTETPPAAASNSTPVMIAALAAVAVILIGAIFLILRRR